MLTAGGGAPSLDDMIMHSIGVPGAQAASDSLLPQLGMPHSPAECHANCMCTRVADLCQGEST